MASSPKVVVITGANSGIGLVATKLLCKEGHHVIMACRSEERAREAMAGIKAGNSEANVTFMQLDLANLSSVRQFADKFHESGLPLHVLVNNAGVFAKMDGTGRTTTEDGFEMTIGINHLGHFLLTHLLLDDLKMAASQEGEARIVVVSSMVHAKAMGKPLIPMDLDDLMLEKDGAYTGFQAYRNSKTANVMFTRMLSRQLANTGVTINCMCPGFIPATGLTRHSSRSTQWFLTYFVDGFMKIFKKITRTPQEGGESIVLLATSEEVKGSTGEYYSDNKVSEPSNQAKDEELQKKLWDLSVKLVKLEASE